MLVKFGSFVTSGSGSLGGHTIQNSKGGNQLRTKPRPLHSCTPQQAIIRSINKQLQAGWRLLTDAQRDQWNRFPSGGLSGHSLWMKYNFGYLNDHLPLITSPYEFKAEPLGPERILNGNFTQWVADNPVSWLVDGESLPARYVTQDSNGLLLVSNVSLIQIAQNSLPVLPTTFLIRVELYSVTTGALSLQFGTIFFTAINKPGVFYFITSSASFTLNLKRTGVTRLVIRSVSVRQIL